MSRVNTIFDSAYKGDFNFVAKKLEEDAALLTKLDEVQTCSFCTFLVCKFLNKSLQNQRLLIHWCSVGGSLKLVTFLVELGSPIDSADDTDTTPLILASSAGHLDIVQLLIEKGANVNHQSNQGHSALQYAASKGLLSVSYMP